MLRTLFSQYMVVGSEGSELQDLLLTASSTNPSSNPPLLSSATIKDSSEEDADRIRQIQVQEQMVLK